MRDYPPNDHTDKDTIKKLDIYMIFVLTHGSYTLSALPGDFILTFTTLSVYIYKNLFRRIYDPCCMIFILLNTLSSIQVHKIPK